MRLRVTALDWGAPAAGDYDLLSGRDLVVRVAILATPRRQLEGPCRGGRLMMSIVLGHPWSARVPLDPLFPLDLS